MNNPCPYCGLDVDIDYVAEGFEPFNQGDILVCDGCGCVEVATGVLWETRLPNPEETGLIRRAIEVSRRPATEHHFARQLGPPATDKQRRGQHAPFSSATTGAALTPSRCNPARNTGTDVPP